MIQLMLVTLRLRLWLVGICFAAVTQIQAIPPANDNFADAFLIKQSTYILGDNTEATLENGEIDYWLIPGTATADQSLWWKWTPDYSGDALLYILPYHGQDLNQRTGKYVCRVFTGGDLNSLNQVASTSAHSETTEFQVQSGTTYYIAAASWGDMDGMFYMALNQKPQFIMPFEHYYKPGEPFSIPVQVAGLQSRVSDPIQENENWLSYDGQTGVFMGTISYTSINSTAQIEATNEFGGTTMELTLIPDPIPEYLSPASATAYAGVPFEFPLLFSREVSADDLNAGGGLDGQSALPAGFFFDAERLSIRGVAPDNLAEDVYPIAISGPFGTAILNLIVRRQGPLGITSPLMAKAKSGEAFSYQITTTMPAISYNATSLPNGLEINQDSGLISGVLANDYGAGIQILPIDLQVEDDNNQTAEGTLNLAVVEEAQGEPEITSPMMARGYVGIPFEYQIEATQWPDQYQTDNSIQGLVLDQASGLISGIPRENGVIWQITSSNNVGSSSTNVDISIGQANNIATVIGASQVAGTPGEFLEYVVDSLPIYDPAIYDPLPTMAAPSLPTGMQFDQSNARIFGIPSVVGSQDIWATIEYGDFENEIPILFRISDQYALKPEITSPATFQGLMNDGLTTAFFFFQVTAENIHTIGQTRFSATGLPSGWTINPVTGVITGSLSGTSGEQVHNVTVRAYGPGGQSSAPLKIVINYFEPSPIITSPAHMVVGLGEAFTYRIESTESSGNYNVSGLHPDFFFDSQFGIIYGVADRPGTETVAVTHGAASALLAIEFVEKQEPLLVTSAPSFAVTPGEYFEFQITTNTPDELLDPEFRQFSQSRSWPDSVVLDEQSGLIRGYWPPTADGPQTLLEFDVYWHGYSTPGRIRVRVDWDYDEDPLVISRPHILAYPGRPFSYTFETLPAGALIEFLELPSNHSYDPQTKTLTGVYDVNDSGAQLDFDVQTQTGQTSGYLTIDVVSDPTNYPMPIITSAAGPVAFPGEEFRYEVVFDSPAQDFLEVNDANFSYGGGKKITHPMNSVSIGTTETTDFSYASYDPETGPDQLGYPEYMVTLTVNVADPELVPPQIQNPGTVQVGYGQYLEIPLEIEGVFSDAQMAGGLPNGLSFDANTDMLSGYFAEMTDGDPWFLEYVVATPTTSYTIMLPIVGYPNWREPRLISYPPPPAFPGIPFHYPIAYEGRVNFESGVTLPSWATLEFENFQWPKMVGTPGDNASGGYVSFGWNFEFYNPTGDFVDDSTKYFDIPSEVGASAPFISTPLYDQTVAVGGNAYFSVTAGGSHSNLPHYQWQKDATDLQHSGNTDPQQIDLELFNAQLPNQGTYRIHIDSTYGEAYSNEAQLWVGTPLVDSFEDWIAAYVGSDINDPQKSGPYVSYTGSGMTNLEKWAFGENPLTAQSSLRIIHDISSAGQSIEFDRNLRPGDVRIVIERSTTLQEGDWTEVAELLPGGSWQAIDPDIQVDEVAEGEVASVTVIDNLPKATTPRVFLRIRVEQITAP